MINQINSDMIANLIYYDRQKAIGYREAESIRAELREQGFTDKEISLAKRTLSKKINTLLNKLGGK